MFGVSTSPSYEIAKKFAFSNSFQMFKPKTILKIMNPQKLTYCVDVSWISPFCGEQELIVTGAGIAFFETNTFRFDEEKFDEERLFVKNLTIWNHVSDIVLVENVVVSHLTKSLLDFQSIYHNLKKNGLLIKVEKALFLCFCFCQNGKVF